MYYVAFCNCPTCTVTLLVIIDVINVYVCTPLCVGLKPYRCSVCAYAGRSKSNLKTHMNRHSTERSHLCDLCGKKFKSKVTLKSHRLSHSDEGRNVLPVSHIPVVWQNLLSPRGNITMLSPIVSLWFVSKVFKCLNVKYNMKMLMRIITCLPRETVSLFGV